MGVFLFYNEIGILQEVSMHFHTFLWENMYELSPTDEVRHRELLRIVHDVCREYAILWGN